MMDFLKGVLVAILVLGYIVAPDLFPGPVDDLLVVILAIIGTVGKSKRLED